MKITYKDFWKGFEKEKQVFEMLFDSELFEKGFDIKIQSVFKNRFTRLLESRFPRLARVAGWALETISLTPNPKKPVVIWYTGENLRPPISQKTKAFLSFDQDTFSGKNVYLPLIYLRLLFQTEFSKANVGKGFELDDLVSPRVSDWKSRTNFACAFINNAEPTRLRAVQALSTIGQVDVFGKVANRALPDKYQTAKNYKFMICFENGIYPGYVTEKLLDAYVCGAIPIYWGDLGKNSIINTKSFINYHDFESLEAMIEFIQGMSEAELVSMSEEPLLLKKPDIESLRRDILKALQLP